MNNSIENLLIDEYLSGFQIEIPDLSLITFKGEDAESFLQGQITQNVKNLDEGKFIPSSRLNARGKIKFNFFIGKLGDKLRALIKQIDAGDFQRDLDQFVISEDVQISNDDLFKEMVLVTGQKKLNHEKHQCEICLGDEKTILVNKKQISGETFPARYLSLFCFHNFFLGEKNELVSNSISSVYGTDYGKGCFVGQEVANKIENNRGGARSPSLLASEEPFIEKQSQDGDCRLKNLLIREAKLIREERLHLTVVQNKLVIDIKKLNCSSDEDKARLYFIKAVDQINSSEVKDVAKKFLRLSLSFFPDYIDSLEALGVLLAEEKKFDEAHYLMDKIIKIEPSHVMARANKSLFFMREGKIEEAEKEKELASNLSIGNIVTESESEKRNKLIGQRKMYSEVLEIDGDDKFALEKYIALSIELNDWEGLPDLIKHYLKLCPEKPKAKLFNLCLDLHNGSIKIDDLNAAKTLALSINEKGIITFLDDLSF